MKDPITSVINAYETALDTLTVDGLQFSFFKVLPEGVHTDYVLLESARADEDGDKQTFGFNVDTTLLIVTSSHGGNGRIDDSEDIANKVMNTIKTTVTSILTLVDFTMIGSKMTGTEIRKTTGIAKRTNKTKNNINRAINFRHIVEQT